MKKKFLSLVALVALAVGITVAVNYVPSNGLKLLGKSEKAEKVDMKSDFSTQVIKGLMNVNEKKMQKKAFSKPKMAEEDWTEWEPFAPMGKSTCTWTSQFFDDVNTVCNVYVRQSKTTSTTKQFKFTNWGDDKAQEFIVNYNEKASATNNLSFETQYTGYSQPDAMACFIDYAHASGELMNPDGYYYYTPATGKFVIKPWIVAIDPTTGESLGFYNQGKNISEECQMDGFADYSFGNIMITAVDESKETATSPGEITFGITNIGKDVAYWKAGIATMTEYQAEAGPVMGDSKYTDKATLVMPYDEKTEIIIIGVKAYTEKDSLVASVVKGVTATKASDWESIGMRPYREDIVVPVYFNESLIGAVYDVEVEKSKHYKNVYRLKNPYGATSPFATYSQYSNAYMYFNVNDPNAVTPYISLYSNDIGFDAEGVAYGKPNPMTIEGSYCENGSFDGYAITFPTRGLVYGDNEGAYYANRNGLFRAVINFRDAEFAFADDAKSVYVGETVKITSSNTFSTPTFESLTPEIATVDAKGVVTAVAPGKAQIKVVQDGYLEFNAKEAVMEIDVEKNPNSYASFVFNTDEGLAALGIEKPAASAATDLTGMTLTSGDVSMTSTDGGTATRVWNTNDVTDLRMYNKGGSFTISVPEGYKIISMDFTGTECSLFGEEAEFETCTKTHTVWNAPEGESVTSKTFAAVGTCKISVIKVKYSAPSLLPPLASNAYYSWQSPEGTVEEVGGKAVASEADPARVNYPQLKYYTISLNGKKDLSDGKYTTVTLEKPLAEGDTIIVYAFKNKEEEKKSGVKFFWGAEGTESAMACGDDFPNLYSGGEPALVKYAVPAEAAGQNVFRMSRSETGTNLFIAQLQIVPYQNPASINEIYVKNAQIFGEGIYDLSGRKVMNPIKGNVYVINGKKYLCK